MKFEGNNQENSDQTNQNENLEYLHMTDQDKFKAKLDLQRMVMKKLFNFSDIGDDPHPGRSNIIQTDWIDSGLSEEFSDLLNRRPELILKFFHARDHKNSPVKSSEIVDEVMKELKIEAKQGVKLEISEDVNA